MSEPFSKAVMCGAISVVSNILGTGTPPLAWLTGSSRSGSTRGRQLWSQSLSSSSSSSSSSRFVGEWLAPLQRFAARKGNKKAHKASNNQQLEQYRTSQMESSLESHRKWYHKRRLKK